MGQNGTKIIRLESTSKESLVIFDSLCIDYDMYETYFGPITIKDKSYIDYEVNKDKLTIFKEKLNKFNALSARNVSGLVYIDVKIR